MASKITRARMTHKQKSVLRAHHKQHLDLTQQELAEWAKKTFRLPVVPCRMTLFRMLSCPTNVAVSTNPETKTVRSVSSTALEQQLLAWVRLCERHRLPLVTGATLRTKADKIRRQLISTATPDEAARANALVFSVGWLIKFQRRHRLSSKRAHGEASSVSTAVVEQGRAALQDVTSSYERHNVFNMDESAYFYCAAPTRTISTERFAGRKQQKKRLTFAVCSNATGSTKLPLLFVGAVKQPRCFKKQTPPQLGVQYESTPKGWMTTTVFQRWLFSFNEQMRAEDRRVLLLVDNVSSHRLDVLLSHVELRMLPPNTISCLQPQDAGIISAFKAQISRIKNHYVVDRFDDVLESLPTIEEASREKVADALFSVDVLVAMRWAEEAWAQVTSITIAHCWRHTRVLDEDMYELVEGFDELRV